MYKFLMGLPESLQRAVDETSAAGNARAIPGAVAKLTERYKCGDYAQAPLDSHDARVAYLQVRMPATFAANAHVFSKVAGQMEIGSMLDIGAGPGTSMWAASEFFPSVQRFTLIERDRELAELGRSLAGYSSNEAVRGARWEHRDITDPIEFEPHDLVLLSYVIGELSSAAAEKVLRAAWLKTAKMLIVIEPGTPRNFARLAVARSLLIDVGGYPAAPCPHAAQCPMAAAGDWCHFSERLQRTAEHRRAKGGALGYEDEKFSYFAVGKTAVEHAQARIVRHPMKHKGHVQMTLCTPDGIQRQIVSKSQKEVYREARDAEWGDSWGWCPKE